MLLYVILANIIVVILGFALTAFFIVRSHKDKDTRLLATLSEFLASNKPDFLPLHKEIMAINNTYSNVQKDLGVLEEKLSAIGIDQRQLKDIFHSHSGRGVWGESTLATILSDQLPPDAYTIRKKIPALKTIPDATINTPQGILVIDSKFPLENYLKATSSEHTEKEKQTYNKEFLKDFKIHATKILEDYVSVDSGTMPFAVMFIPSESIYYYCIKHFFEVIKEFADKGVVITGPLSLAQKINFIRAGLHTNTIAEKTKEIQQNIASLEKGITKVSKLWSTLYNTHIHNCYKTSQKVDKALEDLSHSFTTITGSAEE